MEGADELRSQKAQDVIQGIHRHHGLVLGCQCVDPLDAVVAVQDGADMGDDAGGKVRGHQALVGTMEQRLSQLLLQRAQHPAESLMGDEHGVRRRLNVSGAVGLHEISQLFPVHRHPSFFLPWYYNISVAARTVLLLFPGGVVC